VFVGSETPSKRERWPLLGVLLPDPQTSPNGTMTIWQMLAKQEIIMTANNTVFVDTSAFYALMDNSDKHHAVSGGPVDFFNRR